MKLVFITIACLTLFTSLHAQGITLLYKSDKGWDNPLSWIQINTPAGNTPVQRVPTAQDDVVISSTLSGISAVNFSLADKANPDFNVGGAGPYGGAWCRSLHISKTGIAFDSPFFSDAAPTVNIYTSSGGFVIIDSGSNMFHGHIQLHGGDTTITDLQIYNSTYGTLFSHADWTDLGWDAKARARFIGSTLGGYNIGGPGGHIYADSCTFITTRFVLGDNSTDTILNSTIQNDFNNTSFFFFIGRNAHFVSSNVNINPTEGLDITTSGSVLNGNVTSNFGGSGVGFNFIQEDPANPLPNIINGNVFIGGPNSISISGDVKISGNFGGYTDDFYNNPSNVIVNGENIFEVAGITNYNGTSSINNCVNNFCHFRLEFFGNTSSNINWNGGFPVDTLIINKSGCAKVTCTNSLYVSGATRIESGQLALDPNNTISYKFVCDGDVDIAQGGGLLLRKNAEEVAANMAIGGTLVDHNPTADSTCMGLSNPYKGIITFYNAVLPVTLLDFYGRYKDKTVFLNWRTEREINAKYFIVEKSFDEISFIQIANIAAYGDGLDIKSYQCTDNTSLKRINYYRLKAVDADGRFTYSKIIAIAGSPANAITFFPNPAKDKLFIRLAGVYSETVIAITDAKGSCVRKIQLTAGAADATVNISGLSSGVYSISFLSDKFKNTEQFVKQ